MTALEKAEGQDPHEEDPGPSPTDPVEEVGDASG
jgi:hypothetical protein